MSEEEAGSGLLGPGRIRQIASALGLRPTKTLGQNFVHDAGTVRRIVRDAGIEPGDAVLEIGPGLGSLTLALLEAGALVSAIEIDARLSGALPATVASLMPGASDRLAVARMDAMDVAGPEALAVPARAERRSRAVRNLDSSLASAQGAGGNGAVFHPAKLVANLPYNVAVPVLLKLFGALPSLRSVTVMVQAEVADRLAAAPGSRTYGVPSVKAAWDWRARRGAKIARSVFWPVPNVDSALVSFERREPPAGVDRDEAFAVVDAAFAQRRKTLRAALAGWAGSPTRAETILRSAGVDPSARGEALDVGAFAEIARAATTQPF